MIQSATTHPVRISSQELRYQLEKILSSFFGRNPRIRSVRRRRSNYCSSYTLENLEVELSGSRSLSLVLKDLGPGSLLQTAREVRPQFLYNPRREIFAYRSLLNPQQFGTPICYGAVEAEAGERYWLFLERVIGRPLWQVGRFEQWERAAEWLANFHFHFTRSGKAQPPRNPLLRYNSEHCLRWVDRAAQFVTRRNGQRTGVSAGEFIRLAKRYDQVADRLLGTDQTIIHGEFYPSNILLRRGERGPQICPIDWEVTAIGPGYIDLAALTSGAWSPDQKARLVKRYHSTLERRGARPPAMQEVAELVDYAQLHLAVQWLGWASDWSPPESHERNWLDEALGLANRLGLI